MKIDILAALMATCVGLLGCPAALPDAPPTPAPEVPLALVRLEAPVAAPPGEVALTVRLEGDATGQRLAVFARPPGALRSEGGSQWTSPGVAPASGALLYRQADGAFAAAPPSSWPSAEDGATLKLPLKAEGEWLLFAKVLDANGNFRSQASARVIVSATPALALSINRLVANSDDVVRARVTLASGGATRRVTLYAWLEQTGGAAQVLPNRGGPVLTVYEGPAVDRTFELLGAPLAEGTWTVRAVLTDGSAQLLGLAGAGVQVCDAPQAVGGKVTEAGAALSTASGSVVFRDVADDDVEEAVLGADGSFSARLPPGTWLAVARVNGHAESAPAPLRVDCAKAATLALDVPVPALRSASSTPLQSTQQPLDAITRGKALVYALGNRDQNASNDASLKQLLTQFASKVDVSSALEVSGPVDLATLLIAQDLAQQYGGDDVNVLQAISSKRYDFVASLNLSKSGSELLLTGRLTDVTSRDLLWVGVRRAPEGDDGAILAAVNELAASLLGVVGLEAQVERLQDWPVIPVLTLGVSPQSLEGPGSFTATALLTEKSDRRPEGGKTVRFSADAATQSVVTDSEGVANATFTAPAGPATVTVTASYTRRNITYVETKTVRSVTSQKVTVGFEQALVELERDIAVDVLLADEAMRANQTVALAVTGGTLDTSTVVTDTGGRAVAHFRADGTTLTPTVTATLGSETATAQVLVRPSCNAGMCAAPNDPNAPTRLLLSADPSEELTDGTSADVVADLRVASNVFAGLPITFSLTGLGRLGSLSAVTDLSGLARVRYSAPSTGMGTDTVVAVAQVAGGTVRATLDLHYQPACAACPVTISGPAAVARNTTQAFSANLPVRWSVAPLGSISAKGVFSSGGAPGKTVVTATTIDAPTRTATKEVWVSCLRTELTGVYTGALASVTTGAGFLPCSPGTAMKLTLSVDSSVPQPNQFNFTFEDPNVPNGCRYTPFNPLFAALGDSCEVMFRATNLPGLTCGGLSFRLQPTDNTLKRLAGTWLEDDTVNACAPGRSATIDLTRP